MRKRFLVWTIIAVLAGGTAAVTAWLNLRTDYVRMVANHAITPQQIAEAERKINGAEVVTPAVVKPLELNRPVRLALGCLGLADDDQNGRLDDLVLADLSGAQGLNLVERQSLEGVLNELNLSLSGLVRAKDAVRAGKLLKADWFLLGTRAQINGTNSIVLRLVDARTGILRDAGVFSSDKPATQLAGEIAAFVRQSRQNAASAKTPVFLAIGVFQDLSVNSRQAEFPAQLRGYLTAAYQGSDVTLLEREYVEVLLQEMRLDLAGLTQESATNTPTPMQSAYWLVDGDYQSFETTNLQVELTLNVKRIFGVTKHFSLRGQPVEPVGQQVKQTIDEVIHQNGEVLIPTRNSEIRSQMIMGRELAQLNRLPGNLAYIYVGNEGQLLDIYGNVNQGEGARKRNLAEAIRAFETVLLLDPRNREAKMSLAACFRSQFINRFEEARNYYHEILEEQVSDNWSGPAEQALTESFEYSSPAEKAQWFERAGQGTTNTPLAKFYRDQAEKAEAQITIASGEGPKVQELAEKQLFEELQSFRNVVDGKGGRFYPDMGMSDYAKIFGTNRTVIAEQLVQLLPKMKSRFPELEPFLLATVVTFQVDTTAPVIAEFQQKLAEISQHPEQVFAPEYFWTFLDDIYNWSFEHKLYALAAQIMEGRSRAAAAGNVMLNVSSIKNEDRIKLAYAYRGLEYWRQAADIFGSFSNQPVIMGNRGPWGPGLTMIVTGKEAAFCLAKLGESPVRDPREFEMGKACFCLCTPSTFVVDDNGLWIGISNQLLHLDFELRTNLAVTLPKDSDTAVTCLCLANTKVWIGTDGEGLIEYDKTSGQCRQWTEKDGLLMDNISALNLAGNVLWIGYGHNSYGYTGIGQIGEGGLGLMDLSTDQFSSFTPSLQDKSLEQLEPADKPTRHPVVAIAAGADNDVWFVTEDNGTRLRRYRPQEKTWSADRQACSSLVADSKRLFLGQHWNYEGGEKIDSLGLNILDLKQGTWRSLKAADGLPGGAVSAIALDGQNVWVGGLGYIALVDPEQDKVLKFARLQVQGVDKIQIGGGYLWAQYDWHLHRVPLSEVR